MIIRRLLPQTRAISHFYRPTNYSSTLLPTTLLNFPNHHHYPASSSSRNSPATNTRTISNKSQNLIDDEILTLDKPIQWVDLDGEFQGEADLRTLLTTYDRTKYSLVCVNPHQDVSKFGPVTCIMLTKEDLAKRVKQKLKVAKQMGKNKKKDNPALVVKEFQFAWGIGPHDLQTKLRRIKGFLSKGNRVDVVFSGKKGMAKVTREQALQVIKTVEDELYEHGTEWRPRAGDMNSQLIYYYQGFRPGQPRPPRKVPVEEDVDDEDEGEDEGKDEGDSEESDSDDDSDDDDSDDDSDDYGDDSGDEGGKKGYYR